jgi:hypothetical protein
MIPTWGQSNIKVEATIDSLNLLIGEQTAIHLNVTCDRNQVVTMPEISDTLSFMLEEALMPQIRDSLSADIEVLEKSVVDTTLLNDGKRMTLHQDIIITSFNPGLYHINSFEVMSDSNVYCSNTLALKVWMFEEVMPENNTIDDKYLYTFCGIKGIRKAPLLFSEVKPLLLLLIGVVVLVLLFLYLLRHYIKNQPILRRVTLEPKIPAHIRAGQSLEEIHENKGWMKEDAKEYYTELTDALRIYIQNRFGINATEMTSSEVMEKLQAIVTPEQYDELQNLLTTSDFAKFAKFKPYENEKMHHYGVVTDFVDKTKPEEVEGQEQVIEYIEVVKGMSITQKRWLFAGLILVGISGVLLLAWILTNFVFLFI